MYLCDVGNTNATINHNGTIWSMAISQFQHFSTKEDLYYINVNPKMEKKLKGKKNFINLEPFFEFDTDYEGLGIDRVAACYDIENGIVIDAGSAITVDIMSASTHLGGFILPGIQTSLRCYESISPVLDIPLRTNINLDILPQNTSDAVSFGILKPIIMLINDHCKDKKIYFTGGDGAYLSRFFSNSIYNKSLVFNGMKKAMNENNFE